MDIQQRGIHSMIKVEGITKKFKLYRSPSDRLKEILFRKQYHKDFTALDNISFKIGAGETLGIIGENGAGKSTLLKILSGIVIPDSGSIQIDGKVTGLLELGTGFNYEMTGLENIYMNGTLLGMTRDEIDQKKQTIIEFSELGDFIYEPLKTYSSGMTMRLAFSIAIHADPKCFLVDEALAVGDAYFQQKCMRKIQEFRDGGGSIVFVSHDMNAVLSISDYAIWLKNGFIKMEGTPRLVVDGYMSEFIDSMNSLSSNNKNREPDVLITPDIPFTPDISFTHEGSGIKGEISRSTGHIFCIKISVQDLNGNEITQVFSNDVVRIIVEYFSHHDIHNPDYGIQIRNTKGIYIFGINLSGKKISEQIHIAGSIKRIIYTVRMNLMPGDYLLSIGVANNTICAEKCLFENYLLNIWDVKLITILYNKEADIYHGITNLESGIEVQDVK